MPRNIEKQVIQLLAKKLREFSMISDFFLRKISYINLDLDKDSSHLKISHLITCFIYSHNMLAYNFLLLAITSRTYRDKILSDYGPLSDTCRTRVR